MLSLIYDDHNKLQYLIGCNTNTAKGALLQIVGECYNVTPYIAYLLESFFTLLHTVLYSGAIIITDQRMTQL